MKHVVTLMLWAGLASTALPAQNTFGFDRYQPIIDRAPFGAEPAAEAESVSPSAAAAADDFMKKYRLAMLVGDASQGGYAGLVDLQTKKTVILVMGESSDTGMELLDLRTNEGEATIRYGGQSLLLKMSISSEAPPSSSSRTPLTSRGRSTTLRGRPSPSAPSADSRTATQTVTPVTEPPRLTGPELEKHLREYNMKAIREGMPPLPIQLTPEEDATLVSEGVLPPQ